VPFSEGIGGSGSGSNTLWSGPKFTSIPSGSLIHPAIWPQQRWARKLGGAVPLFGELDPHLIQCCMGGGLPQYQVAS